MNISNLKIGAQKDLLETILKKLSDDLKDEEIPDYALESLLQTLVDQLDVLDEEDSFGTEGWKHNFGVED